MGPGATLDKRRPDLRDELGYIAPPNRKLPPVPGSNYNTCDRIKRGTVISKDTFTIIASDSYSLKIFTLCLNIVQCYIFTLFNVQ